jgi:exosortase K
MSFIRTHLAVPAGPSGPAGAPARKLRERLLLSLPLYALGLLVAYGFKSFYSRAGADDLGWVLGPTCRLVGMLTGISFQPESGAGWINHTHRMIVGPPCAGLNFLIIVFSTLYFSFLHRLEGLHRKLLWLGLSLGTAYALTLGTNAIRIIAATHLYQMDIYGDWITPARVHRLEGTLVYSFSLLAAYLTVDRIAGRFLFGVSPTPAAANRIAPEIRSALVPLSWYILMVVGVPLANRAYRRDGMLFAEHALVVLFVCLALLALSYPAHRGLLKWARKRKG